MAKSLVKAKKSTKSTELANVKFNVWTWRIVVPIIVSAGLLLIANSAIWVNDVLFNTEKFTQITSQALLSESSRNALAGEIVDQALADRPIVKRVVGEPATKFVSGLLGTNLAETATDKVVARLQTAVTTEDPQNIEIDLTGIKNILPKLISLAGAEDSIPEETKLPDTLVLLDTANIPNVYKYATVFLWLAPISAITATILLAYPHIKRRSIVVPVVAMQGFAIVLTGFFAQLVGPLFRPAILSQVSNQNIRIVVENIYNAFSNSFNAQSNWLFVVGGALLLVAAVIPLSKAVPKLISRYKK
ncbi:hypothetical protein KBD20_01520 [Candidatus Saccharibacteria bacterium]|nr:hypothetical protein [Candidatus Saccharibacteria bacterium]